MKKPSFHKIILLLALFLLIIEPAQAVGVLDDIQTRFQSAVSAVSGNISSAATRLFWILAAISLVWTGISLIFRKGDLSDFFAEFIRFILFIGFFWWLLQNGVTFANAIINSFNTLGGQATGAAGAITPSDIMDIAFDLWEKSEPAAKELSFKLVIPAYILLILITVLISLIAVNVLMLNVTAWMYAFAGIFILGFGGSRWTSDMAIGYFKQLLNLGLQILTMLIIVATGKHFIEVTVVNTSIAEGFLFDHIVLMIVVLVLFIMTTKVPPMVGSLAGGFGNGGMGTFGGGTAIAAMSMAGGALFGAAAALKTAGTEMIGAAKAIKAAKEGGNSNSGGGQQSSAIAAISSGSGKDNNTRNDGQPLTAESGAKRGGDASGKGGSGGGQQSAAAAGSAGAPAAAAAENSISGGDSGGGADNAGGSADSGGGGGGSGSAGSGSGAASTGEAGNSTTSSPMFNNNGDFRDPTSMLTSNTGGSSPLAQAMGGGSPPPPPPAAAPKISTWQATKQVARGMVANKFNDAIAKTAGGRVMQRWEQQATNAANNARMQQQQSVAERTANALEDIAQTLNKGDS